MGIIPAKGEPLELYEGSTFDETWTIEDADGTPEWSDPTGWAASLQVRKDFDANAALLSLTEIVSIGDPPDTDGIVLGADGALRIYVTDETMAALEASSFTEVPEDDGTKTYTGVWDLELENPDGERFRYVMGPVLFSREATK